MRLGVNDARFVVSVAGNPFIKVSLFPMKLKARTLLKVGEVIVVLNKLKESGSFAR